MTRNVHGWLLDTNAFLHYTYFEHINWREVLESDSVVLLCCSAVIRELDEKKTAGRTKRLQDRARKVLRRLEVAASEDVRIGPGVSIRLLLREPSVDWSSLGLSKDIQDDWILAVALEARESGKELGLVSGDTGIRLKALAKGLHVVEIPEEYRVKTIPPDVAEMEKLKRELLELKTLHPTLEVGFQSDEGLTQHVSFQLRRRPELDGHAVEVELQLLRKGLEVEEPAWTAVLAASLTVPPKDEFERYRKDVATYLESYRRYVQARHEFEQSEARTVKLVPVVFNSGTTPANDIDVCLHFPDGFEVFREADLPKHPTPPRKPVEPQTITERWTASLIPHIPNPLAMLGDLQVPPSFNGDYSGEPHIEETGSYDVSYGIARLKHRFEFPCKPVFIAHPSWESVRGFTVDFSALASNTPVPVTGELHVKLTVVSGEHPGGDS